MYGDAEGAFAGGVQAGRKGITKIVGAGAKMGQDVSNVLNSGLEFFLTDEQLAERNKKRNQVERRRKGIQADNAGASQAIATAGNLAIDAAEGTSSGILNVIYQPLKALYNAGEKASEATTLSGGVYEFGKGATGALISTFAYAGLTVVDFLDTVFSNIQVVTLTQDTSGRMRTPRSFTSSRILARYSAREAFGTMLLRVLDEYDAGLSKEGGGDEDEPEDYLYHCTTELPGAGSSEPLAPAPGYGEAEVDFVAAAADSSSVVNNSNLAIVFITTRRVFAVRKLGGGGGGGGGAGKEGDDNREEACSVPWEVVWENPLHSLFEPRIEERRPTIVGLRLIRAGLTGRGRGGRGRGRRGRGRGRKKRGSKKGRPGSALEEEGKERKEGDDAGQEDDGAKDDNGDGDDDSGGGIGIGIGIGIGGGGGGGSGLGLGPVETALEEALSKPENAYREAGIVDFEFRVLNAKGQPSNLNAKRFFSLLIQALYGNFGAVRDESLAMDYDDEHEKRRLRDRRDREEMEQRRLAVEAGNSTLSEKMLEREQEVFARQ